MNRDQFLKERMRGVGGSDSPIIVGFSGRKTVTELYLEKRGEVAPEPDNASMRAGRMLEPVVRQWYAEETGRTVSVPNDLMVHPKHAFIIGHPDGLIHGEARGYEGKTARSDFGWGEPGTDQIPQDYVVQVQHYMLLTALPVFDVAVLIGGVDFRIYEVPADREIHEAIVDGAADFWARVQRGEPPEPDFSQPHALRAVQALHRGTSGEVLTATEAQERWRAVHDEACEKGKAMKAVAEGAKARLLWDMGEAAFLSFADGQVLRRKITKRKGYTVEPLEFMDTRIVKDKE